MHHCMARPASGGLLWGTDVQDCNLLGTEMLWQQNAHCGGKLP